LVKVDNLEVDESALTGESETVFKSLEKDHDTGYMGTHIKSGSAIGVVTGIRKDTSYGKIAKTTTFLKPTTTFQKGLAEFGDLIIKVIIVLTIALFGINALLGHSMLSSLLFAV